jgi:hypothetical protein
MEDEDFDSPELGDDEDACGQDAEGYCMLAGTEYCEFECPFRDD